MIAAIGILAAIVIVAINPQRQLAQVRDATRQSDVNALHKAIHQYQIDQGIYPDPILSLSVGEQVEICGQDISETICTNNNLLYLQGSLVPQYLPSIPMDPQSSGDSSEYVVVIGESNQVGITAGSSEIESVTTAFSEVYLPSNISGIQAWFDVQDESTVTRSGANISEWQSRSTNLTAQQPNTSFQPNWVEVGINGFPSIYFDGSDYFEMGYGAIPRTMYAVVQNDTISSDQMAILGARRPGANQIPSYHFGYADGNTILYVARPSESAWPIDHQIRRNGIETTPVILGAQIDPEPNDSINLFYNGQRQNGSLNSGQKTLAPSEYGVIGAVANGTDITSFFDGKIGEILIFDRLLTEQERIELEAYLSEKWDIPLL